MLMFAVCRTMLQPAVFGPAQHWWPVADRLDRKPVDKQLPAGCTAAAAVVMAALKAEEHYAVLEEGQEEGEEAAAVNKHCSCCTLLPSGSMSHSAVPDSFLHSLLCRPDFCRSGHLSQSCLVLQMRNWNSSGFHLHFWNHHASPHSCFG